MAEILFEKTKTELDEFERV